MRDSTGLRHHDVSIRVREIFTEGIAVSLLPWPKKTSDIRALAFKETTKLLRHIIAISEGIDVNSSE